jgi:Mrp family chromosome partitioning ATPase
MEVFLEKLRAISDYAIFDLPPVHACPEVLLLAKKLDGIIFVIKAHHTPTKSVAAALDRLKRGNVRILGGILNGKKYFIPKWLYDRI